MRNNNFDFLRFVFAFIVVLGHLAYLSNIDELILFSKYFRTEYSINGFFFISGFLITYSYTRSNSLKSYFEKRASRLLPAYIAVISLCVLFFSLLSELPFVKYFQSADLCKYLLANLTFQNYIHPCLPGVFGADKTGCYINGSLWTLKIEVAFYLVLPIIIYFANKIKKKYLLFIIIYISSFIYKQTMLSLYDANGNNLYVILARQLPGAMMYFIPGIAMFYYFDYFYKKKILFAALGCVVLIAEYIAGIVVFTPIAYSLIVFLVAYSLKGLNNFGRLGDISYGIYIFHFPIMKTIIFYGFFTSLNKYFSAFCIILIVLVVGFLSWHLIEKKFLSRRRIYVH